MHLSALNSRHCNLPAKVLVSDEAQRYALLLNTRLGPSSRYISFLPDQNLGPGTSEEGKCQWGAVCVFTRYNKYEIARARDTAGNRELASVRARATAAALRERSHALLSNVKEKVFLQRCGG